MENIGADRDLLRQIVEAYLASQDQRLKDIKAAIEQQDAEALLASVELLRSPVQTLLLAQSLSHLDALEMMGQAGDLAEAGARWELLKADMDLDAIVLRDGAVSELGSSADAVPSPAPATASAQVDVDSILDLVGGDRQMFSQLVDAFLTSYEGNLNSLVKAVEEGNEEALVDAIYVLKTSLAMLRLEQVDRRIEALEEMGTAGSMANARQEVELLANELKGCADVLKAAAAVS